MARISRYVYFGAAWLFLIGVAVQVFLAGMVVVAARIGWSLHADLGHILILPLLFMLISMYTGRLPGPMKRLTWVLFLVYLVQADVIIFMRTQAPVLAAFHPVLALVDFALGWALARRAWALVRKEQASANIQSGLEGSTHP